MNIARYLAFAGYYRLSQPFRAKRLARLQRRGRVPISVLFYHRVADWCPNPWTISNIAFKRQIQWLQENYEIVSLAEAQRRIAQGTNDRPTVCITFDDGYADNFDFALPLLLRDKIPFAYFVATQHVIKGLPFLHDVHAGNALRPNNPEELQVLADARVEIGSHTTSHASLGPATSENVLQHEIIGSKHELEDLIGREVRYFAFPFGMPGNLTTEAFRIAYAAGYAGVCSAYGAYNFPGGDPFHLRRIHGDPQFMRFKNWLTLDPRKLRRRDAFDPGKYQTEQPRNEEGEERENGGMRGWWNKRNPVRQTRSQ